MALMHASAGTAGVRTPEKMAEPFLEIHWDQERLAGQNEVEAPAVTADPKANLDCLMLADNSAED